MVNVCRHCKKKRFEGQDLVCKETGDIINYKEELIDCGLYFGNVIINKGFKVKINGS